MSKIFIETNLTTSYNIIYFCILVEKYAQGVVIFYHFWIINDHHCQIIIIFSLSSVSLLDFYTIGLERFQ